MTEHDNSGPAFPMNANDINPGMSLRDYFAAKALGPLMNPIYADAFLAVSGSADRLAFVVAARAYQFADAMIAVRKKKAEQENG